MRIDWLSKLTRLLQTLAFCLAVSKGLGSSDASVAGSSRTPGLISPLAGTLTKSASPVHTLRSAKARRIASGGSS